MKKINLSLFTQLALLIFVVLCLNGVAYYYLVKNIYLQELRSQSQTVVGNVQSFGDWVAQYGRVWVSGESDSFLAHMPTTTENGDKVSFFSKNPALAQREFSEVVAASEFPAKFRMTSHNVMNAINSPDSFEQRALAIIRSGQVVDEYFEVNAKEYRYAQPVYHTEACIVCHGNPEQAPKDVLTRYGNKNGFGFEVGEVAGIISVSIPVKSIWQSVFAALGLIEIGTAVLSILLLLFYIYRYIIRPIKHTRDASIQMLKDEGVNLDDVSANSDSANELEQLLSVTQALKDNAGASAEKTREYRAQLEQASRLLQTRK